MDAQKILFLDIDGVLTNTAYLETARYQEKCNRTSDRDLQDIDPDAVARLNQVLVQTRARLVISSSWNCVYPSLELLRDKLHQAGVIQHYDNESAFVIMGQTPTITSRERHREIAQWLEEHQGQWSKYAIVDDRFGPIGSLNKEWLVRTTVRYGLMEQHCRRLVNLLGQ